MTLAPLLALLMAASEPSPGALRDGWAAALARARARGVPILVHAWAPW